MNRIDEVLTRGVSEILPSKDTLKELMSKRKITLYQGFDPTAPSLHIGHFIGIRKLSQFQDLGHKVIFLIGDFTAMIGDPDKKTARVKLSKDEVLQNLRDYKKQVEKIIRFTGQNAAEVKFNSTWLSKLNFEDILELASHFTVQQMIEREMFRTRIQDESPIYLHEFLYPMMQGYDSAVMEVDLEVGGNDQLFNMMAGRTLSKSLKGKEKFVLTMKMLTDNQGQLMSKTKGNAIFLSESANEMYGKVMAMGDSTLPSAIETLTDLPLDTTAKVGPMEAKKALAFELVRQIHGDKAAHDAKDYFSKTFQDKKPEYALTVANHGTLVETIAKIPEVGSTTKAKILIRDGAVDVNEKTITETTFALSGGENVKIGKKLFIKVK